MATNPKTILVVEDDAELRETTEKFLGGRGYRVVTSPDGWSCLKDVVSKKPDLLLMDINMPKLNGLNALDLIKVTRLTIATPIIVMSALDDPETREKAVKLGADDFMAKPFSYEALAAAIAVQLLNIGEESLRTMLAKLHTPDSSSTLTSGANCFYPTHDAYPVMFEQARFQVLLEKGKKPSDLSRATQDELTKGVLIFAKGGSAWKCLWPDSKKRLAA